MKIGPKYKICRMVGERIFPKCQTTKFTVSGPKKKTSKRPTRAKTEYGLQLLEKQKARLSYGLVDKQFANYVKKSRTMTGNPVVNFFGQLESRLDNVVFRIGLSPSRLASRQMVSHGHIAVNGKRVTIPSYHLKRGDEISVREGSRNSALFKNIEERLKGYNQPSWLAFDYHTLTGKVTGAPQLGGTEMNINWGTIIEFYSRV